MMFRGGKIRKIQLEIKLYYTNTKSLKVFNKTLKILDSKQFFID